MRRFILAIFAAATLAGCAGTKVDWSQARTLKAGMTRDEVRAAMGRPNSVASGAAGESWVWHHVNGFTGSSRTLAVLFRDGVLVQPPAIPDSY